MISGLPKAPAGAVKFNTTFDIDENGILKVTAVDKISGHSGNVTIKNEKGRLTEE